MKKYLLFLVLSVALLPTSVWGQANLSQIDSLIKRMLLHQPSTLTYINFHANGITFGSVGSGTTIDHLQFTLPPNHS